MAWVVGWMSKYLRGGGGWFGGKKGWIFARGGGG